jgi:hypothetical protein
VRPPSRLRRGCGPPDHTRPESTFIRSVGFSPTVFPCRRGRRGRFRSAFVCVRGDRRHVSVLPIFSSFQSTRTLQKGSSS